MPPLIGLPASLPLVPSPLTKRVWSFKRGLPALSSSFTPGIRTT
jgi:hypothetical protein